MKIDLDQLLGRRGGSRLRSIVKLEPIEAHGDGALPHLVAGQKVVCRKSLYKSTYRKNAFSKGRSYEVVEQEKFRIWIKDNTGRPFNFATPDAPEKTEYLFFDYFDLKRGGSRLRSIVPAAKMPSWWSPERERLIFASNEVSFEHNDETSDTRRWGPLISTSEPTPFEIQAWLAWNDRDGDFGWMQHATLDEAFDQLVVGWDDQSEDLQTLADRWRARGFTVNPLRPSGSGLKSIVPPKKRPPASLARAFSKFNEDGPRTGHVFTGPRDVLLKAEHFEHEFWNFEFDTRQVRKKFFPPEVREEIKALAAASERRGGRRMSIAELERAFRVLTALREVYELPSPGMGPP
jgi:hypothetical protein